MNKIQQRIRIDTTSNIIDSFNQSLHFLESADATEELRGYKWFVICFHHALYHLMLYALVAPDNSGIWKGEPNDVIRSQRGSIDVFSEENSLINPKTAFRLIQRSDRMNHTTSSKAWPKNKYAGYFFWFNDQLRNKYVHFAPQGWSLHRQNIFDVCAPMVELCRFLALESGQCRFEEHEVETLKNLFSRLTEVLSGTEM